VEISLLILLLVSAPLFQRFLASSTVVVPAQFRLVNLRHGLRSEAAELALCFGHFQDLCQCQPAWTTIVTIKQALHFLTSNELVGSNEK